MAVHVGGVLAGMKYAATIMADQGNGSEREIALARVLG